MIISKKYAEQDKICNDKIAFIQPFLETFSHQNDAGSMFYSDITILSGPHSNWTSYFYNTEEGKRDYKRAQSGEAEIYSIKFAGVDVVMNIKQPYTAKDFWSGKSPVLSGACMIWKGRKYPIQLDIAYAIRDLYFAQEYRSAIRGAEIDEIERLRRSWELEKSISRGR